MRIARRLGLFVGLLLGLGAGPVLAQSSADALFHEAARQYVQGEVEAARRTVERGLEIAPSDPRLQALRKKLDRQKDRREGGTASPSGTRSDRPSEQSRGSEGQDTPSDAGPRDERSRPNDETSSSRSQRPERDSTAARSSETPANRRDPAGRRRRRRPRNTLSRAQAGQLLRALEHQEQKLLRQVRIRSLEEKSVEKDW